MKKEENSLELDKIYNEDCFVGLEKLHNSSIDLIVTDPPYTISKPTGFKSVKNGVKRFAVDLEFGEWDKEQLDLGVLCRMLYGKLKKSGTCIIFYDIWKVEQLKNALETAGFSMLRLIIWQKTNPVPLNSKVNYLTNSREIAVLAVKGSKPTFNSEYDNGVYEYPIEHSKHRVHPTQKPLQLIKDLILKHSNSGDVVLDTFMGSGTTAIASLQTGRHFIGFELDPEYYALSLSRLEKL